MAIKVSRGEKEKNKKGYSRNMF